MMTAFHLPSGTRSASLVAAAHTGNIGGTLARKLVAAEHDVRITNSKPSEKLNAFAADIGATPVDAQGAVDGADLIILSIPFPAVAELPQTLFANLPANVPIVDTGNYYPGMRDQHIAAIDKGLPESVWVSNKRFVSIHNPIANLYKVPHHNIPSAHHRKLRAAAIHAWRQIARLHAA